MGKGLNPRTIVLLAAIAVAGVGYYVYSSANEKKNVKAGEGALIAINCNTDILAKLNEMDQEVRELAAERAKIAKPTLGDGMPYANALLKSATYIVSTVGSQMRQANFTPSDLKSVASDPAKKRAFINSVTSSVISTCQTKVPSASLLNAELEIALEAIRRGRL